ncbi:MAG TPA: glycosyltransferase family 2 protein [Terriglobales bacterium]|nr:glycosyltransferase family 2 protein [Terriglobales bacterium]
MSHSSVSVAMCTYNGSRYVAEQLQSIAEQTTPPEEMVICDDHSSDRTAEVLQEFATHAKFRVRLIANPVTLGCAANFEQSIHLCGGEIIALADQDDVWRPGKLAAIINAFAHQPKAAYVFTDGDIIDECGQPLGFSLWQTVGVEARQFAPARQTALLLRRNLVTGAAMAFRRWLLDIVLPIPAAWKHDYWIALLGSTFSFGVPLAERLLLYRRHLRQEIGCGRVSLVPRVRASLEIEADYRVKAERLAELRARALARSRLYPCEYSRLQMIAEKEVHLWSRAAIRSERGGARITRLLREAASGRYKKFSSSWSSVVRDLIATPQQVR